MTVTKLYKVFFENNQPLKAELYSETIPDVYTSGEFYRTSSTSNAITEFLIVEAIDEKDAINKASQPR